MSYQERLNTAAKNLNSTAREVWLAGLGAFSRAQDESGKIFADLVAEGEKIQSKTSKDVSKKVSSLREEVEGRVSKVRTMASDNVTKMEKLFEDQVARVLARLGVPTSDDIQTLTKRVQELSKEVKALNGKKAA